MDSGLEWIVDPKIKNEESCVTLTCLVSHHLPAVKCKALAKIKLPSFNVGELFCEHTCDKYLDENTFEIIRQEVKDPLDLLESELINVFSKFENS